MALLVAEVSVLVCHNSTVTQQVELLFFFLVDRDISDSIYNSFGFVWADLWPIHR